MTEKKPMSVELVAVPIVKFVDVPEKSEADIETETVLLVLFKSDVNFAQTGTV